MEWNGKSRGGKTGISIFVWCIEHLGIHVAYALLLLVVPYFVLFAPKAVAASWKYQREVHGFGRFKSFFGLFRHFYTFGEVMIDRIAIRFGLQNKYNFEFDGRGRLHELLDAHKGAVIVSAHFGAWESAQSFFGDYAANMNVVMLDAEAQQIKKVLRQDEQMPFKVLAITPENGLDVIFMLKQKLAAGEYVCVLADRVLVSGRRDKAVSFMGFDVQMPIGPFKIASLHDAPLVIFFALRKKINGKPGYSFRFVCVDEPGRFNAEQLRMRFVEELEAAVREEPYQWFNFYNYFEG